MIGLTNYRTEQVWLDVFTAWYVWIDDAYQAVFPSKRHLHRRGPTPACSDSEIITVALVIDTFFHGHEALGLAFLRQYHPGLFPALPDNSWFNRRRRRLLGVMEAIRRGLAHSLIDPEDAVRVVDTAPIPLCTYMRGGRCVTATGPEYASVMVSRRARLFGMRLYLTTTTTQVVDQWMLAPAAHKDAKLTPALFEDAENLWVLGDNAFHDPDALTWLKTQRQITLLAAPRRDSRLPRWPKTWRRWFNRIRRRIETALSVLCTVFALETPGSRSLSGLLTRTATRLLGYTVSFLTCMYFRSLTSN